MKQIFILFLLWFGLSLSAQDQISLLFVGDLMQHQAQIDAARQGDGYNYNDCFRHVKKEISEADMAIGNLEVTLGGKPYRGYPVFSAPDEYLYAIKEAGFDVLLTANNHCLDKGKLGLERTILMLDSLKIHHAGTYRNPEERPILIDCNNLPSLLLAVGFQHIPLVCNAGALPVKVIVLGKPAIDSRPEAACQYCLYACIFKSVHHNRYPHNPDGTRSL